MMKRLLFLLILFTIASQLKGQTNFYTPTLTISDSVVKQPVFPGGINAFNNFIENNKPRSLKQEFAFARGKIKLTCVIEKNGAVTHLKVISSPCRACDTDAINLLKKSPKWNPGTKNGIPKRVKQNITIVLTKDDYVPPSITYIPTDSSLKKDTTIYTGQGSGYITGIHSFDLYVKNNLIYPAKAIKNETKGYVVVHFIIEKNRKLSHVKVIRGIGNGCDEEAVRLIRKSNSKWVTGKINNISVRSEYTVAIAFEKP